MPCSDSSISLVCLDISALPVLRGGIWLALLRSGIGNVRRIDLELCTFRAVASHRFGSLFRYRTAAKAPQRLVKTKCSAKPRMSVRSRDGSGHRVRQCAAARAAQGSRVNLVEVGDYTVRFFGNITVRGMTRVTIHAVDASRTAKCVEIW
jgi:hypothetical protein